MELERLRRENALYRGICDRLLSSSSREAMERGVCEEVADVEGVGFAWLGVRQMTGDAVVSRASAGAAAECLDDATAAVTASSPGPAGRALAEREPVLAPVDDVDDAAVREAAREHGLRHVGAIPLAWNDALYGVLVAYARDPVEFETALVDVLADVGALVAAALVAAERRRRLHAGRLVELDLRVTDSGAFPYDASRTLDCIIELEGFTAERDGFLVYFRVTGSDATTDAVRDATDASRMRVLDADDLGCTVEATRPSESVLGALADVGATLADATVVDGTATITARLAPDAAIPAVVDRLESVAPDVTLVSKHEVRRDLGPGRSVGAFDALTDRQHTVLEAAYHAGYFEWPRASSGEELATSLGVAPPTFYQHLRAAQRNLLDELVDD